MAGAWIEVFKTGTHTSGNGVVKTYTEDDLASIANTYNLQKVHEAPLVLGHPTTDDPAYGWTKELKTAGNKLLAFVDQVSEKIVDAVKSGEYKKVSIALYPDGLLRHVGLLGATPPAVKGLANVQFAEGVEFEEYIWVTDEVRMPIVARVISGLRDFLIDKFGLETADRIVDKNDISILQRPTEETMITLDDQKKIVPKENINQSPPGAITNFSETEEENMDELKAQIKALEEKLATQATQFSEMQTGIVALTELVATQAKVNEDKSKSTALEASKAIFAAYCDTLIKDGKMLPAEKESIAEEYADLLTAEGTLTFAEGIKPSEKMKTRLGARPVVYSTRGVTFADPKKVGTKPESKDIPVEFSELGNKLDFASLDVDRTIREYAEKNNVTYEVAAAAYSQA
jgi:hypothetical protein